MVIVFQKQQRPAMTHAARAIVFCCLRYDRCTRTMIEALKQKLGEEVEKLRIELNVTLPAEIARAVEMGDNRENSEYKAALEPHRASMQARLGQLTMRLNEALTDRHHANPDRPRRAAQRSRFRIKNQKRKRRTI